MTFSNGVSTQTGTPLEVAESSIRLIVQAIITLAVLGGWIYCTVTGNPAAPTFQVPMLALIGAWFGQSVAETWIAGKKAVQQVELAKLQIRAKLTIEGK